MTTSSGRFVAGVLSTFAVLGLTGPASAQHAAVRARPGPPAVAPMHPVGTHTPAPGAPGMSPVFSQPAPGRPGRPGRPGFMSSPFGLGAVSNGAFGTTGAAFPGATFGLGNTAETYMGGTLPGATFGLGNTAEAYMGSVGLPGTAFQVGGAGLSAAPAGTPGTASPSGNIAFNPLAAGRPSFPSPSGGTAASQMSTALPAGMHGYAGLPFNYPGLGALAGTQQNNGSGDQSSNGSGAGNTNSMTTSGGGSGGTSSGGSGSGSAGGGSGGGYGTTGSGGGGGSAAGGDSGSQASSGYGNSSGGVQRTGRLQQNRRGGDRFLADVLSANGLPNQGGRLHWPLGLLGLPDASGDTLRSQVDTALTLAANRQEHGESAKDVLRKVRPALRQLQRLLYDKEGEIPEQEYQESRQFLRKLKRAVSDLE